MDAGALGALIGFSIVMGVAISIHIYDICKLRRQPNPLILPILHTTHFQMRSILPLVK